MTCEMVFIFNTDILTGLICAKAGQAHMWYNSSEFFVAAE
jgi:hypothetical protein